MSGKPTAKSTSDVDGHQKKAKREGPIAFRERVFGIRAEISESVHHLTNDSIVYPAGSSVVIHSTVTAQQKFFPFSRDCHPVAMALSANRELLAICFSGSMASIEVWSVEEMHCEKILGCTDVASKSYVNASFSAGNKMLVAQGGPPDWTLALFLVEKGKVFSVLRLTDSQDFGCVTALSFHPTDAGVVSVIGDRILMLMRLHDKLLKTFGYSGGQDHCCKSQEWFDDHVLLVGSFDATILILEDGELQTKLNITDPDLAKIKEKGGKNLIGDMGQSKLPLHVEVSAIQAFDGGFLCACGPDKIFLFQKSDNIHEYFTQILMMRLCEPSPAARVSERGEHTITCISLSPNQSEIVAATHSGQIFSNRMPSMVDIQMQNLVFAPMDSPNHEGNIVDADSCVWKPLVVTAGSDRTLRAWDLDRHKLLFYHTFKEQIYSVALHPTGLHVAVGLTDALHLYHLLFGSVRHYKEMKTRRCSLSKFSWGGQYLAAVDGNLLLLCSSIFLKRAATLKGHTNKITGIAWLPDDSSLVSCSIDGGIFGWDLLTKSVAWEIRQNECRFLAAGMFIVEKEGPTILSGCSSMIYHINIGQMVDEVVFDSGNASCITFCPARSTIIVGTLEGCLVFYDFPAISSSQPWKTGAHASAVRKVVMTTGEDRLISCGADGIVILWKFAETISEDSSMKVIIEKISNLPRVPEMLVSQLDIEKMKTQISKQENNLDYMKKDKSHHLSLQDRKFHVLMAEMKIENDSLIASLSKQIQDLEKSHEEEKQQISKDISALKEEQISSRKVLVEESRQKLIYEYEKQDKIENKLSEMQSLMETEKQQWEENSKRELERQLEGQKTTIQELNHQLLKVTSEMEKERLEDSQLLRLVEASTEVELSHIQASLNSQLAEEQRRATDLRESNASLLRKITLLEKDKETNATKIRLMKEEKRQLEDEVTKLQKNLVSLRKEIRLRNEIVAQREEELGKYRSELEVFKKSEIVKEHEISRLEANLQPTQELVQSKTNQLLQLEEELSDLRLQVESRDRQVRHLSQRLTTTQGLNNNLQKRLHTSNTKVLRLQSSIAQTSKVIHNPKKLKEAFKSLTEKSLPKGSPGEIWTRTYLSENVSETQNKEDDFIVDASTHKELLRQRTLLEETLEMMKSKEKKDKKAFKSRLFTLVKENRYLLDHVKLLERKISSLESSATHQQAMDKSTSSSTKGHSMAKSHPKHINIPVNANQIV